MTLERQISELQSRVAVLEHTVQALAGRGTGARSSPPGPVAGVSPFPPSAPPGPPTGPRLAPPAPVAVAATAREAPTRSFDWGVETVLRWAGVVLVSLAAIFVVSTAVRRGWIGPELQLLAAALAGAGLSLGSWLMRETRRPWAVALGAGGSVVLGICALAVHHWLDLAPADAALGLFAVTILATGALALRSDLEQSAVVTGLLAVFAPLGTLSVLGVSATLGWLTLIVLGSCAVGVLRGWPALRLLPSWAGAAVLALLTLSEPVDGRLRVAALAAVALIAATLWSTPILAGRWNPRRQPIPGSVPEVNPWTALELRLVAVVPAWLWITFGAIFDLSSGQELGLVGGLCAAGAAAVTGASYGLVPRAMTLATLLGALSLSAVALVLAFDGPVLMIALGAQAVVSLVLSRSLKDAWLAVGAALAGTGSAILAWTTMAAAVGTGGFQTLGEALATALVTAGAVVLAWLVERSEDHGPPMPLPLVAAWGGVMSWLAALLAGVPQGLVLISASWAAMAATGLVVSLIHRHHALKNTSLVTLGVTLAKLVTIDLAGVDVFWRAGLFGVVGVGLIVLGLRVPALMAPDGPGIGDPGTPQRGPDSAVTF